MLRLLFMVTEALGVKALERERYSRGRDLLSLLWPAPAVRQLPQL